MKRDASEYLNILRKNRAGLESAAGAETLRKSDTQDSLERLKGRLSRVSKQYALASETNEKLIRDADDALTRLHHDGVVATLGNEHRIGLEAIVITDGSRPCPLIQDQKVVDDETLGSWKSRLNSYETEIESVIESVGRIDSGGVHQGTGFVVGDHLIMTNRHVLESIGSQDANGDWTIASGAVIDFRKESGRAVKSVFSIDSVVFAGPDAINRGFNLDWLDMAVLGCKPRRALSFPAALQVSTEAADAEKERDVYVVGYPAKPAQGHPYPASVLDALFDGEFSVKRWAPGRITQTRGAIASDSKKWAITHDTTTLGGNSGSCMVDFGPMGLKVIGLHFAGATSNNYAHVVAELVNLYR